MTQLSERTYQRLLQQLDSQATLYQLYQTSLATLDASSSSSRTGATVDAERSFYEAQGLNVLKRTIIFEIKNIKYEVVPYEFPLNL